MKKSIIFSLLLAFTFQGFSQVDFKMSASKITMSGTSTLHDWTADVTKSTGSGSFSMSGNTLTAVKELSISMNAKSIKSEKGSKMDNNMYKALKTSEHPNITFSLTKVNSLTAKNGGYEVLAEGKLTIAGTTKTVSLTANGKVKGNNEIVFTGSKALKMTDFNIEPPVMMLGTLKTGNDVTITFETTFSNAGISLK